MSLRWFDLRKLTIFKLSINKIMLVLTITIISIVLSLWKYIGSTGWEYCNLLVVLEAVCYVVLFLKIDIRENKLINSFAGSTFAVYLLHGYFLIMIRIDKYASMGPLVLVLHILISTTLILIACFAIDRVFKLVFGGLLRKLSAFGKVDY
jgi:fucose 4-O-acetylase-like acetyltransferase